MINSALIIPNYLYINLAPLEKGMPKICKEGTGEIEVGGYVAKGRVFVTVCCQYNSKWQSE